MKKFIVMTVITACLALCAAVWPQTEVRNSKQKLKPHRRQRKD